MCMCDLEVCFRLLLVSSWALYLVKPLRRTLSPNSWRNSSRAGPAVSLLYISSSVLWPALQYITPTFTWKLSWETTKKQTQYFFNSSCPDRVLGIYKTQFPPLGKFRLAIVQSWKKLRFCTWFLKIILCPHTPCSSSFISCSVTLGVLSASLRQDRSSSGRRYSSTSLMGSPRAVPCFEVEGTASSRIEPRRVVS